MVLCIHVSVGEFITGFRKRLIRVALPDIWFSGDSTFPVTAAQRECGTNSVKMRCMARSLLVAFLCAAIAFVSFSQPANIQRVADIGASPLKNRIPPPDPNKYRSVRDARDWQNPYLMVQANGIRPISGVGVSVAPIMSPADVVAYLEKLPSIAWPYGLVVAVQENGIRAGDDDARIKKNREELVGLLEKAGVKVAGWPSA
jgi:hypothetical protein